MVVMSSGNEVPKAMMVRAMIRSEIPAMVARAEAELTTNWLPAITPTRPRRTKTMERLSLYLGFSTAFLSLRFWWTILKM